MYDNGLKPGYAGKRFATFVLLLLNVAFAIGCADDKGVIVGIVRFPFIIPERPRQVATGVVNFGVSPCSRARWHGLDNRADTTMERRSSRMPATSLAPLPFPEG
jgi:hypothetical protein